EETVGLPVQPRARVTQGRWPRATRLGGEDRRGSVRDVRSGEGVPAAPEDKGTVAVWWLYRPREMKATTLGGYLELVSEFEVKGGGAVHPHQHTTHEFYYVVSGRGLMTIAGEERQIVQGDLVHIPPDAVHSLRPVRPPASVRCFCFAIGLRNPHEVI